MKSDKILSDHQLKRTSCREGIIDVMMESKEALSENEIREQLQGNYDRTTFYRSFKTLEEKKIIHKIVVDNQIIKYALDNQHTQSDQHPHFYCNQCKTVQCLNTINLQTPSLPDGFVETEMHVMIKGICNHCQKNNG